MSKPTNAPIVLSTPEWNTSAIRYMQPKINERGGKSISLVSTQSGRALHVSTPLMMTWGIADFVDEKTGEADGKFSMSLNFPGAGYENDSTNAFLNKMKAFENQVLDDAVKNSEAWFGEEMSREVAKHTFFPVLKYSKDKLTKKFDYTKPPSIRAKVPNYNNRWGIEIYNTKQELIFPCENENMTPMDFIPKKSNVACVLQCGGLWFGGKGWGLTWKLVQCVVKPQEVISVYGRCHIQLSNDEIKNMDTVPAIADADDDTVTPTTAQLVSTEVDDSDAEQDEEELPAPTPSAPPATVKKVVKKAVAEQVVESSAIEAAVEPVKKKIVKKVVKPAV
jgi:hypothetical protein